MKTWESAFNARSDIQVYGDNALGLFALALRFHLDDINTVAAESITDGNDDKKCDIVFLNKDDGVAVICQNFFSQKAKASAPANKASDLNTAVTWLLARPVAGLPERIKSSAEELREAIREGTIGEIFVWYTHNLPESENVKQELLTVEHSADAILKREFHGKSVKVKALEVGSGQLEKWYKDTLSPILVNDEFNIQVSDGYELKGKDWKAYVTTVSARFLYTIYRKYRTRLFSANIRDYLGSRKSDVNINHGIKKTAESSPENFWVFNNGLTILVNSYETPVAGKKLVLKVKGLSIVNGAQTTGAIGSLPKSPKDNAIVPVRFVQTADTDLVYNIIQYNNSQNKITASDFRSRDNIQKRLREEFQKIPSSEYEGGRRGGFTDVIKRTPQLLPSYTVGQALAAMHQDPAIAYNQKTNIWISDTLYSKYFNEEATAMHIVFAFSLLRAAEARKMQLVEKSRKNQDGLTEIEKRELEFFRHRGATYLLVAAISSCLEIFIKKPAPNKFRLSFGEKCSPTQAQDYWASIVEVTAPLCEHLEDAFTDGLKNTERINKAIRTFQSLVQATSLANSPKYQFFSSKVFGWK
ncbi:MAG: AIPR family protein [Acidobacteria bacterium]|nr:AIPR family protein [Acidobacteriota bacterium]